MSGAERRDAARFSDAERDHAARVCLRQRRRQGSRVDRAVRTSLTRFSSRSSSSASSGGKVLSSSAACRSRIRPLPLTRRRCTRSRSPESSWALPTSPSPDSAGALSDASACCTVLRGLLRPGGGDPRGLLGRLLRAPRLPAPGGETGGVTATVGSRSRSSIERARSRAEATRYSVRPGTRAARCSAGRAPAHRAAASLVDQISFVGQPTSVGVTNSWVGLSRQIQGSAACCPSCI